MAEAREVIEKTKPESGKPTVSAVLADGSLVEMVCQPDTRRTLFSIYRGGTVRYEASLFEGNERLVPYSAKNNLLQHDVVLFPSLATEYESEQQLVEQIQGFIHRYVDVSPLFEQIASYYVLFSWVYDAFNELPYLRQGDTGSGKTRFLLTAGSLCYKPIFASGASTVSPLFRILDSFRGTLIVDEGDFRFSDEKAEIVKILNNGNARGFPVPNSHQRSASIRDTSTALRASWHGLRRGETRRSRMVLGTATRRVLALDLRPRSVGFVVFEGPDQLLDSGVKAFRNVAGRNVPAGKKCASLLAEFQPSIVLLKNSVFHTLRRKAHREGVLDTIQREAGGQVAVRLISPQRIRQMFPGQLGNKDDFAAQVAARFPDLAWKLAPQRKVWQREHYRMSIFDAAALAFAYYGPASKQASS